MDQLKELLRDCKRTKDYQRELYGGYENLAKLDQSHEIWQLIDFESIWIAEEWEINSPGEFKLVLTCNWDEEHGLGVTYRDWKIVNIGGAAD